MNKYTIYLLTLGCDKNRVDGEVMLGRLISTGAFTPVDEPEEAEVIIVNTCGFIADATQESINTILELASHKANLDAPCRALIVTGCMAERYRQETKDAMPEVDAVLGVKDADTIVQVVAEILDHDINWETQDANQSRVAASPYLHNRHIAHIKISDGCDNACTYCTIPSIRGAYTSRPMEDILEEATLLINASARELVLVAQDTALYGMDIYGQPKLHELIRAIAALPVKNPPWIRLMYAYPEHITQEIIRAMAEVPTVCKYIDMPIQHSETEVLRRMGRTGSRQGLKDLIANLRRQIPGIALRTTLMVGFPGETVEDFRNLYEFVKETRFDRLGVFPYSRESGTPAAVLPQQTRESTKLSRLERIMDAQQEIHFAKQKTQVGKTLPVMVDSQTEDGEYIGRTGGDAYEVDAMVTFSADEKLTQGCVYQVKILDSHEYDLRGEYEPAK